MTNATTGVKVKLHRIVDDLERLRAALLDLPRLLPAPLGDTDPERSPEDLDTLDEATELRSVILCVDQDGLRPAIQDLRTVAGERPGGDTEPDR
jgi:hypothetical protein